MEYDTLKGDMEQQLDDSRREKEEDEQRLREYFAAELKAKDSHYQVCAYHLLHSPHHTSPLHLSEVHYSTLHHSLFLLL